MAIVQTYVGTIAWWLVTLIGYPPTLATPFGATLDGLQWLTAGGIITLMYFTPLTEKFRSRVRAESAGESSA